MSPSTDTDQLFRFTTGPRNARVVIVGEAWGENEAQQKKPFVGYSGKELDRMLAEAGLQREACLCSNLIHAHPEKNDFTEFLFPNKEAKNVPNYFGVYPKPALSYGISVLWNLIDKVQPTLIIAAGNWPLHILTRHATPKTSRGFKLPGGITSWRGSQTYSRSRGASEASSSWTPYLPERQLPVLPLIHPAAIVREWGLRSITVHDLRSRAKRFLEKQCRWDPPTSNDLWRPTFDEVMRQLNLWLAIASTRELKLVCDIETLKKRYITCLGLADEDMALCIPFFYFHLETVVPYFSLEQELTLWMRIKSLLEHPNTKLIGQNFIYDSLFLHRYAGINASVEEDTMVMHHLLYPGTPKALHYLASLYCDHYCYWKDESSEWDTNALSAEDLWRYNCKDLRATSECAGVLRSLIKRKQYEEQLKWRMREWKLARKMTIKGMNFDDKLRKKFQNDCLKQATELQQWLLNVVPPQLAHPYGDAPWYDSPKGLMDLLYTRLGFTPVWHKDTGRPTTNDAALEELVTRKEVKWFAPALKRIQALRSLGVFRSHFLDINLGPTGRLHSQFNIAHPETFRWSSSVTPVGEGTNTQNLPKVKVD